MSLKAIKAKIKSVKNLKKITRALEVVSTVKLQRVKDQSEKLKNYLQDLLMIISFLGEKVDIFEENNNFADKQLAIVVTSDRWLCWSLNSKLLKKVYENYKDQKGKVDFFVIGKKWLEYLVRMWFNVVGNLRLKDTFEEKDLLPLYSFLNQKFANYWKIDIWFNYFKNTLVQIPVDMQIYPFKKDNFISFLKQIDIDTNLEFKISNKELIIEPDIESVRKEIMRQIRNYMIYSAILQNKTWEHAARMIAMKNAGDNSDKMIKTLTLSFNKARQASITKEISEITSAKMAIEENS